MKFVNFGLNKSCFFCIYVHCFGCRCRWYQLWLGGFIVVRGWVRNDMCVRCRCFFGVLVNIVGGNGWLHCIDWMIEMCLGIYCLGVVYNSILGSWYFSFEMIFDGIMFVDDFGVWYDVFLFLFGMVIFGMYWVYVGFVLIKMKGGRLYEFGVSG